MHVMCPLTHHAPLNPTNTMQPCHTPLVSFSKPQSPKDAEKLKEAKERVYLKGFYEGVMKVGLSVVGVGGGREIHKNIFII